jgi:hypothetical protein
MTRNNTGLLTHAPGQPGREAGKAPAGEPANAWVTPEAERRPRRREGTVSDPDRYPQEPLGPPGSRLHPGGTGTVSDPDA